MDRDRRPWNHRRRRRRPATRRSGLNSAENVAPDGRKRVIIPLNGGRMAGQPPVLGAFQLGATNFGIARKSGGQAGRPNRMLVLEKSKPVSIDVMNVRKAAQ